MVIKGASKERARGLIRTYYSRVEFANKLFTCHLEGWKTDRGLISIIFGPPNYISNNKNMEVWNYGDENNINALKFIFEKKMNPFSSNDFVLKGIILIKIRGIELLKVGEMEKYT